MKILPLSIFIFSDYFTQGRSFSSSLYIFLYMYSPHRQRRFFFLETFAWDGSLCFRFFCARDQRIGGSFT